MILALKPWQQRLVDQIAPTSLPRPRTVPIDAPWTWLAAGWRDMWRAPWLSLGYGAVFALAAAVIAFGIARFQVHSLFIAVAGGFLLVGPFVAVGLYECSRRLSYGQSVSLSDLLNAGSGARGQLAFFGVLLMFIALAWLRLAMLLMAIFLGTLSVPPPSEFLQLLLFTPQGLGLLVVGSVVGGALAAMVFALSAVAIPLLLVEKTDAVTAARASLAAVCANPIVMALWAALIVVMMGAGFLTLLIGLIVAFPLIGHATWYAYRDIYGQRDALPPV